MTLPRRHVQRRVLVIARRAHVGAAIEEQRGGPPVAAVRRRVEWRRAVVVLRVHVVPRLEQSRQKRRVAPFRSVVEHGSHRPCPLALGECDARAALHRHDMGEERGHGAPLPRRRVFARAAPAPLVGRVVECCEPVLCLRMHVGATRDQELGRSQSPVDGGEVERGLAAVSARVQLSFPHQQ